MNRAYLIKLLITALTILVLLGCTTEGPPPTQIKTPEAAPLSTLRPASTETPRINPDTPTPEFTPTNQPSATLPAISKTLPSPTLTPIPIPTLPEMELTQQVLWLFETNNGCQLPCWWGITPGQTTWQMAQEFLSIFDSNIPGRPSATGSTYYGAMIPRPKEVYLGQRLELSILVNEGIVERIATPVKSWDSSVGYLNFHALPTFLTTYGSPSEVGLFTYSSPREGELPFITILFYAEQGIAASYSINNGERQGEIVRGCIQDEPVSFLSLWSADLNLTFEEVTTGSSALDRDYLSLEESTEMSIVTFYETFKNSENTTCLETPAELWR